MRTIAWAVPVVLSLGAEARAATIAERCKAALKVLQAMRFEKDKPKPIFVEIPNGIELQVPATGTNRSEVWRVGRCVTGEMEVADGKLTFPKGWLVVDGQGHDSHVGAVYDERDRERLRYDMGAMAGAYASEQRTDLTDRHEEKIGEVRLRWAREKKNLVITLGENTNFWGPTPTRRDTDLYLAIARSLKPKQP